MALVDDLAAQVADLQERLRQARDRNATLHAKVLELDGKTQNLHQEYRGTEDIISGLANSRNRVKYNRREVLAAFDAFVGRMSSMTKAEIVAAVRAAYAKLNEIADEDQ